MTVFTEVQPTLENYWRSTILFGRNVASHKPALGKSLLKLSQQGKEIIILDELGSATFLAPPPYHSYNVMLRKIDRSLLLPSLTRVEVARDL